MNMSKEELVINEKYNKFSSKEVDNLYRDLYADLSDNNLYFRKLKFLFSFVQESLNNLLEIFNERIKISKHYCAEDSRQLIELIENVFELRKETKGTNYSFIIDDTYELYLNSLLSFLKNTNGTTIPDSIETISIKKYDPIFKLKINVSQFIDLSDSAEQIIKIVSIRDAKFEDMTFDEKIGNINIALENVLKKNDKYINVDSDKMFCGFITNDSIKNFRNMTHCFRHGEEKSLNERNNISKEQKSFLINYGITILNTILMNKNTNK